MLKNFANVVIAAFVTITPLAGCGTTFNISNSYTAAVDVFIRDPTTMVEEHVKTVAPDTDVKAGAVPEHASDFDVLVRSGGSLLTNGEKDHLSVDKNTQEVDIAILPDGSVLITVNPK